MIWRHGETHVQRLSQAIASVDEHRPSPVRGVHEARSLAHIYAEYGRDGGKHEHGKLGEHLGWRGALESGARRGRGLRYVQATLTAFIAGELGKRREQTASNQSFLGSDANVRGEHMGTASPKQR